MAAAKSCIALFDSLGYPALAGAIMDLSPGSAVLLAIEQKVYPITTHPLTGVASQAQQTSALNNFALMSFFCPNLIPLGGFQQLFGEASDLIVGVTSQRPRYCLSRIQRSIWAGRHHQPGSATRRRFYFCYSYLKNP